ncbi:MAG: 23S rRNA (adenine(2503)-C(2))-methyltransferase RlmN [Christensenellaceae bacterium]|jgi:23S rRNA (adenine2503-C2)-methyltransferase|nr:23S rRNA (adenine(2503)-C(2))-methyltransferase RlmN [Christensenellaceae bacterium]
MLPSLDNLSLLELQELAVSLGEPKFRGEQLYGAVLRGKEFSEITNLPKAFIEKVSEKYTAQSLTVHSVYTSRDKSQKYLFTLSDGNIIESVFMPHSYGDTVCVSTQCGCRMGCVFCASGEGGLVRSLTAGEIFGQVIQINRRSYSNFDGGVRNITNIVLMGSGEPLDNYDEVVRFVNLANEVKGLNISRRNISLSTVGIVPNIYRLADENVGVTLAISLHASDDNTRNTLIPMNKKYPIEDIIKAAKYFVEKTGRRVCFEYAMTGLENSSINSAKHLARLVKGFQTHVNLIPLNFVKEKDVKPASEQRINAFLETLTSLGVSATIRFSSGGDSNAACGQLRARFLTQSGEARKNTPTTQRERLNSKSDGSK